MCVYTYIYIYTHTLFFQVAGHEDKRRDLYCVFCEELACDKCALTHHRDHVIMDHSEVICFYVYVCFVRMCGCVHIYIYIYIYIYHALCVHVCKYVCCVRNGRAINAHLYMHIFTHAYIHTRAQKEEILVELNMCKTYIHTYIHTCIHESTKGGGISGAQYAVKVHKCTHTHMSRSLQHKRRRY